MKRTFYLGLALVSIFLFSISCGGVSQEALDKANGDLEAAQTQINQLQEDLTEKDALLEAANEKLTRAKNMMEFVDGFILPFIYGEFNDMGQPEMLSLLSEWQEKVDAIGDTVLTQKFQAIIDSISGVGETEPGAAKVLMEDIFSYVLEKLTETLG